MARLGWTLPSIFLLLVSACGDDGSADGGGGATESTSLSQEELTAAETGVTSVTTAAVALDQLNGVLEGNAGTGGDAGGKLDNNRTEAQNVATLQDNAAASDGGGGCVMVTPVEGGVVIDYGPPPGCTLQSGSVVSGTLTLGLTLREAPARVEVSATFDAMIIDGLDYDGTGTLSLTEGSVGVLLSLTSAGRTTELDVTLGVTPTASTIDGSAAVADESGSTTVSFAGVRWVKDDCYPSAGTATVETPTVGPLTVTFDALTPTTGEVQVSKGRLSAPVLLPPYGACPPPV
jgi:hypothetical protein